MKALTFTIELLEPLLATGLEGDPNAGVSLKFIAGSVLRGVVIGLYLREQKLRELSLNDQERNLFFNGKVRYLNSYPLEKNQRSLPVPLSWQKVKEAKDDAVFQDFCFAERDKEEQYKDIGVPFFVFETTAKIYKVNPEMRLAVHTQRDAKKGRSTSEDGAVFRYESVAQGTKFSGAILSEDEICLNEIKRLMNGREYYLGGSRTAGYGRVNIHCSETLEDGWTEVSNPSKQIDKGKEFTITLLSNALIRDEQGQFQAEIASIFATHATPIPEKTFKRAELVGGFNRKWGLPLPQQLSIKAGSVFKFTAKDTIAENTIKQWLNDGIGERTLDGFGRIAINLSLNSPMKSREAKREEVTAVTLTNADSVRLANKMNERILRQRWEANLVAKVGLISLCGKISNSQISRLRQVVHEAIRTSDETKVSAFFNDLKKTARDQFERVKVSDKKMPAWSNAVLAQQDEIKVSDSEKPVIGNVKIAPATLTALKLEYHLRLIDGVLAKAAKENQQ